MIQMIQTIQIIEDGEHPTNVLLQEVEAPPVKGPLLPLGIPAKIPSQHLIEFRLLRSQPYCKQISRTSNHSMDNPID